MPLVGSLKSDYDELVQEAGTRRASTEEHWRSRSAPRTLASGTLADAPRIHFEAVPAASVEREMRVFLGWFDQAEALVDGMIRAGLAHFRLLTVHPFDDSLTWPKPDAKRSARQRSERVRALDSFPLFVVRPGPLQALSGVRQLGQPGPTTPATCSPVIACHSISGCSVSDDQAEATALAIPGGAAATGYLGVRSTLTPHYLWLNHQPPGPTHPSAPLPAPDSRRAPAPVHGRPAPLP